MTDGLAMTGPTEEEPLDRRIVAELPALRAYVRRLAARGEVEDLVQDVVARALKYRAAFQRERALGPWLRATALRAFLDQRSKRRHESIDADDKAERGDALERVAQRETLDRVLARLSAIERDVVLRFHARDESVAAIAVALAMPENTVKSHLHRARRKLAEDVS